MKRAVLNIRICLEVIRCFPHVVLFYVHPKKEIVHMEVEKWLKTLEKPYKNNWFGFLYLLSFHREYRNLFYARVGFTRILSIFCPRMSTLYLSTDSIGPGLFIQHGFATIVAAKSIGKNCWINQQVTIGYSNRNDQPTILDNVKIHAGAKVIGNVTVGNNAVVGANAVVVKDVPDNCVVVGVPARIIKRDGKKVCEELI